MKYSLKIGDKVKLTKKAFFDGTVPGMPGTVVELTEDAGTGTYYVQFEDGSFERFIYPNEIERNDNV